MVIQDQPVDIDNFMTFVCPFGPSLFFLPTAKEIRFACLVFPR